MEGESCEFEGGGVVVVVVRAWWGVEVGTEGWVVAVVMAKLGSFWVWVQRVGRDSCARVQLVRYGVGKKR